RTCVLLAPPTLRLRLSDAAPDQPELTELLRHPLMARVRGLDTDGGELGGEGVKLLLTAPAPRQLRSFTLWDVDCSPQTARAVATYLPPTVRSLSFVGYI